MGKFPVISISLKSVDGLDFKTALAALKTVIGNEAIRFQFLKESEKLSAEEKEAYARLIKVGSGEDGIYAMTDKVAAAGLQMLSQLLARHYGRKVILLIDEYDVPLDKAFQGGYYDEMVSLIRNLFGNALKTNDSLYFAVLTGCMRISKESIFTGLNNLKVHTISDVRYDEYFGFTNLEVDALLEFYGLSSYKSLIRDWYDGYRFGNMDVYCPWDVINYCDELLAAPSTPPKNYWANTSGNSLILRLLEKADQTAKDEVEELLNGRKITKRISQELTYRDIEDSAENVWSVLYAAGYLTGKHVNQAELRKLFYELVQDWFRGATRADAARINRFCAAFPAGDPATIQEMLSDYLWDSISVRDTAVRTNMKGNFHPEGVPSVYHGMMLGLLRSQGLKYADDGNLEKACSEALKQIEEKKYTQGLKRRGTKKIIKYGIAFCEKECMVVMA